MMKVFVMIMMADMILIAVYQNMGSVLILLMSRPLDMRYANNVDVLNVRLKLIGVNMYEYNCTIVKVIDGDTTDVDIDLGFGVWMKKQRIRFYGVDTPESRTRDKEEKVYGLMAKEFVQQHLPVGSKQVLRTKKDGVGKYGRILGEFVVGDTTVNQLLIDTHNAVAYHGQSKEEIAEEHIKNRGLVNVVLSD